MSLALMKAPDTEGEAVNVTAGQISWNINLIVVIKEQLAKLLLYLMFFFFFLNGTV